MYVYAIEEYYDKLLIIHTETGYGGRDRMYDKCKEKGWSVARYKCKNRKKLP